MNGIDDKVFELLLKNQDRTHELLSEVNSRLSDLPCERHATMLATVSQQINGHILNNMEAEKRRELSWGRLAKVAAIIFGSVATMVGVLKLIWEMTK